MATNNNYQNFIKPRVAIVSINQLERIQGTFVPIFCINDNPNYQTKNETELRNMYANSTYMICHPTFNANTNYSYNSVTNGGTEQDLLNDSAIGACYVVTSDNSLSINLCDNYEKYHKHICGNNDQIYVKLDNQNLYSYTYNYITTAFQATGDRSTICHTAAYINIYDNIVTQEFRNDGQYSMSDALKRRNSSYTMYVSLNIDPYYDAEVVGGKNMTYTPVTLFKCSNYGGNDNTNVTLVSSEKLWHSHIPSNRGKEIFTIGGQLQTFENDKPIEFQPEIQPSSIILNVGNYFTQQQYTYTDHGSQTNGPISNFNDKQIVESIILANPMCSISYNTKYIKTANFITNNGNENEVLLNTQVKDVYVELNPGYVITYPTSSNGSISYSFVDEYSSAEIHQPATLTKVVNDIYDVNFVSTPDFQDGLNIKNNLNIKFTTGGISEKKYIYKGVKPISREITIIANLPSKEKPTAKLTVTQQVPVFEYKDDWATHPTP